MNFKFGKLSPKSSLPIAELVEYFPQILPSNLRPVFGNEEHLRVGDLRDDANKVGNATQKSLRYQGKITCQSKKLEMRISPEVRISISGSAADRAEHVVRTSTDEWIQRWSSV